MDLTVNCDTNEKVSMKTSEYRKVIKPLLERRRRARINSCLDELKGLIMESAKNENADASKLEKADILELTVQHLRNLRRANRCSSGMMMKPTGEDKFQAGFAECAQEVSSFLSSINGVENEWKCRLLTHLSHHISRIPPQLQHPDATPLLLTAASTDNLHPTPPPSPVSSPFRTATPTTTTHTPEYLPITPVDSPVYVGYQNTTEMMNVWPMPKRCSPPAIDSADFYVKEQRGRFHSTAASYHPYFRPTVDSKPWRPW